jgi:hypothetical protein
MNGYLAAETKTVTIHHLTAKESFDALRITHLK